MIILGGIHEQSQACPSAAFVGVEEASLTPDSADSLFRFGPGSKRWKTGPCSPRSL